MLTSVTKRPRFDYILPGLLISLILWDLLVGLSKGVYPTQATPLSVLSGLVGLYLANQLRRLTTLHQTTEEDDPEG
ncbi:MAG: hypothetical protein WCS37_08410, partial [Chloroflexota bacterium]